MPETVVIDAEADVVAMKELHGELGTIAEDMLICWQSRPTAVTRISTDTAFAIGEAFGVLSKAKELLGRDIDNAKGFG
jgi:hypothetical protein